jgi:hypothetical protein
MRLLVKPVGKHAFGAMATRLGCPEVYGCLFHLMGFCNEKPDHCISPEQ